MVRQREVEDRADRLLDPREVGELLAPVQRHRAALGTPRQRGRIHVGDVALGVGGGAAADEQAAHAVHERDQARAGPPADHGIALPVAQARAARPRPDVYFVKLRWTCPALNLNTVGVQLEHRRRLVPCFVVCLVYFMRECLFR